MRVLAAAGQRVLADLLAEVEAADQE